MYRMAVSHTQLLAAMESSLEVFRTLGAPAVAATMAGMAKHTYVAAGMAASSTDASALYMLGTSQRTRQQVQS